MLFVRVLSVFPTKRVLSVEDLACSKSWRAVRLDGKIGAGQPAAPPHFREVFGLPDEIRQLPESDGDDERRRARGEMAHRAVPIRFSGVEPELVIQIVQANRLEIVDFAIAVRWPLVESRWRRCREIRPRPPLVQRRW